MKTIGRIILSAILAGISLLLAAIAKFAPKFFFSFYTGFSQKLIQKIGGVTDKLPFALWEAAAALIFLGLIYTFICIFTKHRSFLGWLSGVLVVFCAGLFLFVALWGLNHFAPTIDQSLGLTVREYSQEELIAATSYYAEQLNAYSGSVERDEENCSVLADFSELSKTAKDGYAVLAEQYSYFEGLDGTVKKLAAWPLYSRFGTTGIFICMTGESCVNPDTYEAWIPFTMCHELAHRQAVAAEDGANFCAYLACMENPDSEFRYSGALAAYVYCNNALYAVNPDAAAEIWSALDAGAVADLQAANVHYEKYEGKVQDAAQKVNDAYLKAFDEESGVQSYGEVADLLIAWYLQNAK